MNVGKTKTMIFNFRGTLNQYPKSISSVEKEEVANELGASSITINQELVKQRLHHE